MIPWRRERLPTPIFWPGEFNRQRSLVGYTVYGVVKNRTQLNDFHFSLSENIEMLSRSKSKHLFRSPCMGAKLLRLYPTLCDPMDCSLPGSFVHRILQARILEWVAISSSRRSSRPRDQTLVSYVSCIGSLPLVPPGKPLRKSIHEQIAVVLRKAENC